MNPPADSGVAAVTPPPVLARGPLELEEIKGPSAFGGERLRFFHLLWLNTITDFRLRYMHSWLGYLWTLLRPLVFFGVIFGVIRFALRGIGSQVTNYPEMLLMNIMLFMAFTDGVSRAVKSVAQREGVVRKMQFPRIVIPLSVVLSSSITAVINLFVVFAVLAVLGLTPRWTWLLLPVVIVVLLILTTGIALLLSALYPRFRDVDPAWSLLSRLLFYATPILYAIEIVSPQWIRTPLMCNPVAPIIEQARVWVIDPTAPTAAEAIGGAVWLLIPIALFVGLCVAGFWVFEREAPRVAEEL